MPLYPPFWRPFKQNGGHSKKIGLSQKLRGPEFQFLLYVYVLGGIYFIESIAEYIMPLHPPFWKPFINMAAMSKVIRLSQKLRGVEPSISTLCLGFVGRILADKVLCRYSLVCVSTRYQPF